MVSTGVIYGAIVVLAFIGLMFLLDRLDVLEPFGLELSGPFLLWKTKKGRNIIERISQKKRFWKNYGNMGLVIVSIGMILIFLLVAWSAYVATSVPADQAPQANEVLVLPGLNPIIPLGYGILSLAIAIIVHEFSHGILSRVADIDIKSLGLVFLVVPIGAFVEPDEDQMDEVDENIKKDRLFAAGPTSNIVLAIIVVLIFSTVFIGSISAREKGVMVTKVYDETPAERAGIEEYDEILKIGDQRIKDSQDLNSIDLKPMQKVEVQVMKGKEKHNYQEITTGLVITGIYKGYPADKNGLKRGDIIYKVEGELIKNRKDLTEVLESVPQNEKVNFTYQRKAESGYRKNNTELGFKEGLIGITSQYLGFVPQDMDWVPNLLGNPLSGSDSFSEIFENTMVYIALPFLGLSPLPDSITQLYQVTGPLSVMPSGLFWMVAHSLYWIFWMNLLVGLFNSLPAVPLDGGYLFKDGVKSLTKKLGLKQDLREKVSNSVTYAVALLILFLLMWQMIGPRI